MFLWSKVDFALMVNRWNSPFWDTFFRYYTWFGTFGVMAPIIFSLAFLRYRFALMATLSTLMAFLLTQFFKRVIWYDAPRPKVLFAGYNDVHYVNGVHLHAWHSFPSGHTCGAFALFATLAFISKNALWKGVCLMSAILVGYSRMYLSQHFLEDVLVGSLIGTFSAWFSDWWFNHGRYAKVRALDGSLKEALAGLFLVRR
jgi:membrane-associated phospholipid phosphatase